MCICLLPRISNYNYGTRPRAFVQQQCFCARSYKQMLSHRNALLSEEVAGRDPCSMRRRSYCSHSQRCPSGVGVVRLCSCSLRRVSNYIYGESSDRFSVLMDLRRWVSENIEIRRSSPGCLVASLSACFACFEARLLLWFREVAIDQLAIGQAHLCH